VIATFDGSSVRLGKEGKALYDQSGFGRPAAGGLILSPEEALYLLHRNKIEIKGHTFDSLLAQFAVSPGFFRRYLVYRDMRERGYVIQPGPHDFRVYRRGQKPKTGQSHYVLRVLPERELIRFETIIGDVTSALHMRKQYVLAVVDDEDELTYYDVKLPQLKKAADFTAAGTHPAKVFGTTVIAEHQAACALEEAWFGTRLDAERLMLSPAETIFLAAKGMLHCEDGETGLDDFIKASRATDAELAPKMAAYTHLRELGYIPRTGYKFGHHFRVYSGISTHSEMLVHALGANASMPMSVISRSVRLAHSVRKKMLFACANENTVQYIEFARIKL
jgi:tRNA-intron endonuclease